jgi:hypothetical protein
MHTNIRPSLLLLASSLAANLSAAELAKGDPAESVLETLGRPESIVDLGDTKYLYYARGEVVIADGRIARLELVSAEEAERRAADEAAALERRRAHAQALRADRIARGEEMKLEKLSDPEFLAQSPEAQLMFWNSFARTYPEVDISAEHAAAVAAREERLRERREDERIARAEAAARRAEARAEEAERAAAQAHRKARFQSSTVVYERTPVYREPPTVYRAHSKVIIAEPAYCPPVRGGVILNLGKSHSYHRYHGYRKFFHKKHGYHRRHGVTKISGHPRFFTPQVRSTIRFD